MAVLTARPTIALKNIVVATDFSPSSELALNHAVAIARRYGSKVHLVHPLVPGPAGGMHSAAAEADAEARLYSDAEKFPDVECSRWVLKGTPLEVVERIVSFDEIDLVVVGTHGAKGLHRLTTGSAAEHFFRHVHCPVLAVGPSVNWWKSVWEPQHILLATDLQSDESAATRCAVLLAREHDARLSLLHVAKPERAPYPQDQETIARPYFNMRLRELLSYKPELDYPTECCVEFAEDAAAEIVRVARQRGIDVIVLSVHRSEPWGFHFEHDAYRIVSEAPCPVLITQRRY